jgi:prepilin-type N-terminal cleavage/methylation domain-containing protein
MRKGFTMIEIMVVIVILAVLVALSLGKLTKSRAKIDQRQAESYLRAVRISQKMYYARYAAYACSGAGCSGATAIKTPLGCELKDGTYTFSVAAPTSATFTATADTAGTAEDLTLDQDGTFKKNGTAYTPP